MSDADADEVESPWATTVVLGDGETAFIRPLGPDDRDALLAFHERQSSDSVYRRFFSPKPTLNERELDHFTDVDMVDRAALAVELQDEFIAWASYERWPGRNEAEAAFMVDDRHHGRGIATLLLEHLAAIARANGIDRFTAEVLADNRGMLAVFAKAGWPLERRFESGVVDLDWNLAATEEFLDSVEAREQRADSRAVARILLPRAVAVVGASDTDDSVGNLLWKHLRASVSVPVYPVNPRLEDLDGRRCFGSVADLPDDTSLAVIAVPTRFLESTIDDCIAKRMRGAVIVTNLAGDDDAARRWERVVARARRYGLRLIGPSSMGVASLHEGSFLQAALIDVRLPAGRVAVSMQSGSLGGSVLRRARDIDLGLSWFVSLGDKSDVSANDLMQFWEDDDNTRVIALYTETFGNPRKFARIARRVSRSRPIVAVRTGAAADGPMGGALYRRAGLIEVPTVQALLDTCRVLADQPILAGRRVAVVTNSPSPGTLADAALRSSGLEGVRWMDDLDWTSRSEEYRSSIGAALADPDVDGVLAIYAPPVPRDEALVADGITAAADAATKPVVAVMIGSGDGPIAPGSPVPGFAFPEQAAAALGRSYAYAHWLDTEAEVDRTPQRHVDPARAQILIAGSIAAAAAPGGRPDDRDDPDADGAGPAADGGHGTSVREATASSETTGDGDATTNGDATPASEEISDPAATAEGEAAADGGATTGRDENSDHRATAQDDTTAAANDDRRSRDGHTDSSGSATTARDGEPQRADVDRVTVELDVVAASTLLSTYGIPTAEALPATPDTAVASADRLGYPVAIKAARRRPGRSARSGVALDLDDRADVEAAVGVMRESLGDGADELVVQRMTTPGITVRVRCAYDERLGAIVTVGYGGIDADVIGDEVDRLAPVSPSSAAAMLTETRVGAALVESDFDPSPLVDVIVQASQLCADHLDIDVLDLNPVIVSENSAVVTDVVVRLVDRPDDHGPLRRLR